MITANDLQNLRFGRAMRGYNTDEVDKLLDAITAQLEQDTTALAQAKQENETLRQEMQTLTEQNDSLKHELQVLSGDVEAYHQDEGNLKSALINAQRMGESIIQDANKKAEYAQRKAEARAQEIVRDAMKEIVVHEQELQRLKEEVAQFKANILSLYRQHIESISTLPDAPIQPQPQAEMEQEEHLDSLMDEVNQHEAPAMLPIDETQPPQSTQEEVAVDVAENPIVAAAQEADAFWAQDEAQLAEHKLILDEDEEEDEGPEIISDTFVNAFKGIQFSD